MSEKLKPEDYKTIESYKTGIPLTDVFPDGIEFRISGDEVELLTPPDSRYHVIDGILVREDEAKSTEPSHVLDSERQSGE